MKNKKAKKRIKLKAKYRLYISYTEKVIFFMLLFFVSLFFGLESINKSLIYTNAKTVDFEETGTVDYKVYLKENDFYEEEYLTEGMAYIASLINNIEINYKYIFNISDDTNVIIAHEIIGKLSITDEGGENLYFEKEYTLEKMIADTISNRTYTLDKKIDIDYDYYNEIANNFKSSYGINTTSNFSVYLKIHKISNNDSKIDKTNEIEITIPLSKKAININMNTKEINNKDNMIIEDNKLNIDKNGIIKSGILLFISIIAFANILSLLLMIHTKKSSYDKLLSKVLKEYDRLIVSTTSFPELDKFNVLKIDTFNELLDVRDNLKLPIMYYNIREHQKCHFYILQDENVYLLTLKSIDMESKNEENK